MNGFSQGRLNNPCSYLHCAFYIYGSKVGAHYQSTLFADLNLEITGILIYKPFYHTHGHVSCNDWMH